MKVDLLEKRLKAAYKKLDMVNLKSHNAVRIIQKVNTKIDQIESEVEQFSRYEVQGLILRSKARYVSQGEHSTKYFFNLEKEMHKQKL